MISVVIPNFNRGKLIGETLQSLCMQSFKDFEVLVIDDHSSDNSQEIVLNISNIDSRVKWFKRPDILPKGGNSCRNYGFEIAQGKFIKWLDSDDLLDKYCLEIQSLDLVQSKADLSICEAFDFTESYRGVPIELRNPWGDINADSTISNYLLLKLKWHTGSGLWRKSSFKSLPIWDVGLSNSQEWLMHLKQLGFRLSISKVSSPLVYVRTHQHSMSNKANKGANYYFNECKARMLGFGFLSERNIQIKAEALKKMNRQFFWYHIFILYKKGIVQFCRVFRYYPIVVKYNLEWING